MDIQNHASTRSFEPFEAELAGRSNNYAHERNEPRHSVDFVCRLGLEFSRALSEII
jgi:hypothetical protein